MKNNLEIISRAIVVNNHKLLLCKTRGAKYFFLPGGHVEFGETAIQALKREFKEEINGQIKRAVFLGALENIFTAKRRKRHEILLLHLATLKSNEAKSIERHLSFEWINLKDLKRTPLRPKATKILILKALKKP